MWICKKCNNGEILLKTSVSRVCALSDNGRKDIIDEFESNPYYECQCCFATHEASEEPTIEELNKIATYDKNI